MIKIVNKQFQTLAILSENVKAIIKEQINGEYMIKFSSVDQYELKLEYIKPENLIEVDGQLFQIAVYENERADEGKVLVDVLAEQVSYALIDEKLDNFEQEEKSAGEMLALLLKDTGFTVGTVDVPGVFSVKITKKTTKREVLNQIAKTFGGEFEFDRYQISFVVKRGTNRGVEFRIGKNIEGVKKKVDATKKDGDGNPLVSFELDVVELLNMDGFEGLEGVSIGDTVKAFVEELGISVTARVMGLEYNPELRFNSKVTLGRYEDIFEDHIESKKTNKLVSDRSSIWDRSEAISPHGTVFTEILEGKINTLQNEVVAGLGSVKITDHNGILVTDQPTIEKSAKAVRLLGGLIAISNQKDVNGNFVYRTFGDGDGFTADLITAGTLTAERIGAGSLTLEKFASDIGKDIDLSGNPIIVSLDTDIKGNYSLIQQQSDQILLKVGKGEVISSINQSAESVRINAEKIDLEGIVTVTDLETSGATTINGDNIITGSISAERIRGGILSGVTVNIDTDLTVGHNVYLGGTGGIRLENSGGDFYLGRAGSRIMKFWNDGIFASKVLAIENGGAIGIHTGISGSNWSSLITLYQNSITIGGSGRVIPTNFYYDIRMNNKPITDVSRLDVYELRSRGGSNIMELSNNSLKIRSSYIGFFGATTTSKRSVSLPSNIVTDQTAGSTYSSTEKYMLNDLKTDVRNIRDKLNDLISALRQYGLV